MKILGRSLKSEPRPRRSSPGRADQPWAVRRWPIASRHGRWHAEGDVWTHTRMVVRRAGTASANGHLSTATGNRSCCSPPCSMTPVSRRRPGSTPATGRTAFAQARSGRHGDRSSASSGIWAATSWSAKRLHVNLVRYHGRPPHICWRSADPARELISLSWLGQPSRCFTSGRPGRRCAAGRRP